MLFPEDTFSYAKPECPHPERWHAVNDIATEDEVIDLVAAMVDALRPDFVIETGTYQGFTAEAIGKALYEAGIGRLVTLECEADLAEVSRARCQGLPVEVLTMSSLDYTPDEPIDFAWFDSALDIRADEFRRFLPYMHERTIVGFHDTGPQHIVRRYLDGLVDEGLLRPPLYLPTPRGVAFAGPSAAALT